MRKWNVNYMRNKIKQILQKIKKLQKQYWNKGIVKNIGTNKENITQKIN